MQIIGFEKGLKNIKEKIDRVCSQNIPIFISGESGTGKELIANYIHQKSHRSNGSFVALNCAGLTESLLEAELFGYEKGAFTGALLKRKGLLEQAHQGTLFLDEVQEMSPAMQVKLLRVLQEKTIRPVGSLTERKVDFRLITATNHNLEKNVKEGSFRLDLYYRIYIFSIDLPPLRERLDDIEDLFNFFFQKYQINMNRKLHSPLIKNIEKLKAYYWPGNIREFENFVQRSVALSLEGQVISLDYPKNNSLINNNRYSEIKEKNYFEKIDINKKQLIIQALIEAGGNKSVASQNLGLHRVSLYKMMKRLDIQ